MAILHSQRSSYLSDREVKYHKVSNFLVYVILIGTAFITAMILTAYQKKGIFVPVIILIFAILMGKNVYKEGVRDIKRYLRKGRNYGSGFMGEELVQTELSKLPDTFHVFCDLIIPGKRGNLDFVIVGPNSIFLIDGKNSSGNIYYSGGGVYSGRFGMNYIPVMQKEITKFKEYLNGPLINYSLVPILLFSNPRAYIKVKQPVQNINILSLRQINNFLLNYSGSNHNVERAVEVLMPLTFRPQ